MIPMQNLRLPKSIEAGPHGSQLRSILGAAAQRLWSEGELEIPIVNYEAALVTELKSAFSAGQMLRGLDSAVRKLEGEERGLKRVDERSGVERGQRVSRLLLLSDDGAERFYRQVERCLLRHGPRVLAIRLRVDAMELGEMFFGPGGQARCLLIHHKDAVSGILMALVPEVSVLVPEPSCEDSPSEE
jgi:hypothetical protein